MPVAGLSNFVLDELDEPRIQPSEVLVEIRAAGVNAVDTCVRCGTHVVKPPLPYKLLLTTYGSCSRIVAVC